MQTKAKTLCVCVRVLRFCVCVGNCQTGGELIIAVLVAPLAAAVVARIMIWLPGNTHRQLASHTHTHIHTNTESPAALTIVNEPS